MIDAFTFSGSTVAVFGLGRSGLATATALGNSGAEVWAWDDDAGARARAGDAGVPLVDLYSCDWQRPAAIVLSPGIPHTHPYPHPLAVAARSAGCEIIGDMEILARAQRDATFVGITGTNGKSTTTALIGHILESTGHRVQVGGNIGDPVLAFEPLGSGGTYVLEMSSYQLELTHSLVFDVAVLLNLSADHLDRHGGMDGYVAAKRRIFAGQDAGDTAIVGNDDERCRAVFAELERAHAGTVVPVWADDAAEEGFTDIPTLPGSHNRQNAAAAAAVARSLGIESDIIAEGVRSYPGLVHRQERVAVVGGILWVNDSKATNAEAAARAVACYDAVYWIAGGQPKEGGLDAVVPQLHRVRHAFLIGEAAGAFADSLAGRVPCTVSVTLETAVAQAWALARDEAMGDAVVLLSPACASFDQFSDFEARGDAFKQLVGGLA